MKKETSKEKECKKNLTKRQIDFVQEYMKTNNVRQSAIKAGYSAKTASVQGSRLLSNVKVSAYIQAIAERLESDKIADIQEVMEYLTSVMRGEKKDQFDLDPDVRARNLNVECAVTIIDDIPADAEIEYDED